MITDDISARINQLRREILIHSIIYYRFNENLIDDHEWARMGIELCELQDLYPEIADGCVYADAFKDFDPSTGQNLPLDDPWAVNKALYLLELCGRKVRK